ncbi:MAG: cupin domain-containing protein [Alphaproteobacteria bacterium]|nr:cupin domain-containing protein [Alphaproteobacteria bacterium]
MEDHVMSNFHSLTETLAAIATTKPSAMAVKGLTVGEGFVAGVLQCGDHVLAMHRQPNHEELLVVLEGEATFRVGDELREIRAGDFIVVPRNAVHGTVAVKQGPLSLLSVFTPRIDFVREVVWEGKQPAFQMVG